MSKAPVKVTLTGAAGARIDGGAAADLVEHAVSGIPLVTQVRSARCGDGAVVVVKGATVEAVHGAVTAVQSQLPPGSFPLVGRIDDDVAVFAVRAKDPFAARDVAERALRPALSAVPGVSVVDVRGGKRSPQVQLDLARLVAHDVTVLEVLRAVGGASSLEATVVKSVLPPGAVRAPPSLTKAAPAPPVEGEVRVLLPEVATVGLLPVGEPLRRDGAVEVRVKGAAARDAVVAAVKGVALGDGVTVAALDDDSVEGVDVVVAGGDVVSLQRELLAIPGVRLLAPRTALRVDVDAEKAKALGVSLDDVAALVDVVRRGRVVLRNTENVTVTLAGEVAPELLSQLVVQRTPQGALRLLDVATVSVAPSSEDRLDGRPATRLRVQLDVGVRKNALAAIHQALQRHPELNTAVEDAGLADAVCP
jgi:multidrug efflux pump subunit AcrB